MTFDPTNREGFTGNEGSLQLGAEPPALGGARLDGCLDEVQFFKRVLSTAEIDALWRAGADGKCKCGPDDLDAMCPAGETEYDLDDDGCAEICVCDAALFGQCAGCSYDGQVCDPGDPDCGANAILLGDPSPGTGVWFLARPSTAGGTGTWDPDCTEWTTGRDAAIGASGDDCP